jgi:hypothetical protein
MRGSSFAPDNSLAPLISIKSKGVGMEKFKSYGICEAESIVLLRWVEYY